MQGCLGSYLVCTAHMHILASCKLCSQDGLDSPARAMFEASVDEQPASPQYLLPMEYTHADADAEVYVFTNL